MKTLKTSRQPVETPDLSTTYLGLKLKNPLVASASPLTENPDNIRALEDAGAAAIVFHSLFEEQILRESDELNFFLAHPEESYGEATSYFPNMESYNLGPEGYLKAISHAKQTARVPIIGSLNGVTPGGWTRYAKLIEEAGADALELNVYYLVTDPKKTAATVERQYLDLVREVKSQISIPLAVKVSPFFSAMANIALRLRESGADALVLFNRFYQPDFDLNQLNVVPNLELSTPSELRLRLRWVAILFGKIKADMAVTGGVHSAEDVVKCVMAGANVAMMTSALLKNGIGHLGAVLADLTAWMKEHQYESVEQMRGCLSERSIHEPEAFERANYLKMLGSYTGRSPKMRGNAPSQGEKAP
jgi:dihydroorotate dehydrogenase (fumarate)